MIHPSVHKISRRTLLQGTATAAALLAAPVTLRAQPNFVRRNLASPEAKRDVESYRRGVAQMLALPPDHPHNWYRNAVIHLMDCPHGNWWFTVWHRGYLGYFERIIRKLSGDPEFALPYWDWTEQPFLTADFFSDPGSSDPALSQNALDPSSNHFVDTFAQFEAAYKDAFRAMFDGFTVAQKAQLTLRRNTQTGVQNPPIDFDTFWNGWDNSVASNFVWTRAMSRSKTAATPQLTDRAAQAVEKAVILAAIRPTHFSLRPSTPGQPAQVGFNSIMMPNHHGMSGSQAVLELQPHNQVHNNLGFSTGPLFGIMPSNLSSVDPIFFMHHSNVDRIWDVWTRKQQKLGLPIGPEEQPSLYFDEEFLFFLDENGKPVATDTKARAFMDTARFGYAFTPGTGAELAVSPLVAQNTTTTLSTLIDEGRFSNDAAGSARVTLTPDLTQTVVDPKNAASQIANITFTPPHQLAGVTFDVFVSPKGETPDTSANSPELATSFSFFGMLTSLNMAGHGEPATVSVDITEALNRLEEKGIIAPGAEVDIALKVRGAPQASDAALQGQLQSVTLEAI